MTSPPAPTETPLRNGGIAAACAVCGEPLPVGGARTTCSDRCRQAAWRRRHQVPAPDPVPLPARRSAKEGTVYECSDCGARLLGEQHCECGQFMSKVGSGGLCPDCSEPITVDELLAGSRA